MPFQLPHEIEDFIIDFLHDDKSQLAACSLVCRAWLPAARHHLFGAVFLLKKNYRDFPSLLGSSALGKYSLEYYIKDLHVNFIAKRGTRLLLSRSAEEQRFGLHEIIPQLSSLRALKSIHFSFISLSEVQILELISSFPLLEEIHIDSNCYAEHQPALNLSDLQNYKVSTKLRVVDLWWCTIPPIMNWIHWQADSIPAVQILSLRPIASYELPPIGQCLRALGGSLLELILDFNVDRDLPTADQYSIHLSLERNSELRSISLFNIGPDANERYGSVQSVPFILSSISSPRVESIDLILSGDVSDIFEVLDCSLLESIFKRPQFDTLRMIRIELFDFAEVSDVDLIRESLPLCDARKILVIEKTPELHTDADVLRNVSLI